jgi:hypothetical protein
MCRYEIRWHASHQVNDTTIEVFCHHNVSTEFQDRSREPQFLRTVRLDTDRLSDMAMDHLSQAGSTTLKHLELQVINVRFTSAAYRSLGKCTNLETLVFQSGNLNAEDVKQIGNLSRLRTLHLHPHLRLSEANPAINLTSWSPMANSLTDLDLGFVRFSANNLLTDANLEGLQNLTALEKLRIHSSQLTGKGLRDCIAPLTNLKELALGSHQATIRDVAEALAGHLVHLRILSFVQGKGEDKMNDPLDRQGLEHFAQLQELYLIAYEFNTKHDRAWLQSMKSLRKLYCSFKMVSPALVKWATSAMGYRFEPFNVHEHPACMPYFSKHRGEYLVSRFGPPHVLRREIYPKLLPFRFTEIPMPPQPPFALPQPGDGKDAKMDTSPDASSNNNNNSNGMIDDLFDELELSSGSSSGSSNSSGSNSPVSDEEMVDGFLA